MYTPSKPNVVINGYSYESLPFRGQFPLILDSLKPLFGITQTNYRISTEDSRLLIPIRKLMVLQKVSDKNIRNKVGKKVRRILLFRYIFSTARNDESTILISLNNKQVISIGEVNPSRYSITEAQNKILAKWFKDDSIEDTLLSIEVPILTLIQQVSDTLSEYDLDFAQRVRKRMFDIAADIIPFENGRQCVTNQAGKECLHATIISEIGENDGQETVKFT
jgi:hypothetical protein